jgi:hypothetical protein
MLSKKRNPSISPKKIQAETTHFTGKKADHKASPLRTYAAAVSQNQFEVLSDKDDEDVALETDQCDSSVDTQVTDNAQQSIPSTEEGYQLAQSRKTQRLKDKKPRRPENLSRQVLKPSFCHLLLKPPWKDLEKPRNYCKDLLVTCSSV